MKHKGLKLNLQLFASSTTKIADVIQPEVFTPYVVNKTMELSELIQSGIAEHDKEFDALASGPNTLIHMPFWNDLTGEVEIMDDDGETVPGKITTGQDIARKLAFVKSFGANALAGHLAGDDPMRVIADRFADYWNRTYQKVLLSTLDGVFASTTMKEKVYDITAELGNKAVLNSHSFLDAQQLMGDAKELLTAIMMHSEVENHLVKQDEIEVIRDSEGNVVMKTYKGKKVIVDDAMAYDPLTKSAEMYLFGRGAIAWGNGSDPKILETEVVRKGLSLAGEDILVNRKLSILHPRGVKFTESSVAGKFPTLDELENGLNFQRVYEPKKVRIVKFLFKLENE
ncbi:prophage LambdaCh01,coat protein [Desulfonispora thiosulfatigenes DSM 11270]|uniref:Prophage LambdaCh01,coat protein n=1 Tax=Desulfonispora thiosulfatigenes DSM 11270 TaxID=656914 RepID=A0A1W1VQ87_DESTI|nr:major capsid protein [Desulfonispora thiosulfatigenes]SMB95390.1 prophage LambdaCh01,coat protein [Desulfonispora thiosulfatigenes DSM 11270]